MVPNSPENAEELFVQLFALHERELRAFARSMGLDWTSVDDVIQTVSLVMWRKWSEFDPTTEFMPWARVITRFEVLKYRRSMARDRHVFRDDVMELLAGAAEELDLEIPANVYRTTLQECLHSLPPKSAKLIRAAYQENRTIRDLSEEIGQSATSLYKTLDRIRAKLRQCVQQRLRATP